MQPLRAKGLERPEERNPEVGCHDWFSPMRFSQSSSPAKLVPTQAADIAMPQKNPSKIKLANKNAMNVTSCQAAKGQERRDRTESTRQNKEKISNRAAVRRKPVVFMCATPNYLIKRTVPIRLCGRKFARPFPVSCSSRTSA